MLYLHINLKVHFRMDLIEEELVRVDNNFHASDKCKNIRYTSLGACIVLQLELELHFDNLYNPLIQIFIT